MEFVCLDGMPIVPGSSRARRSVTSDVPRTAQAIDSQHRATRGARYRMSMTSKRTGSPAHVEDDLRKMSGPGCLRKRLRSNKTAVLFEAAPIGAV